MNEYEGYESNNKMNESIKSNMGERIKNPNNRHPQFNFLVNILSHLPCPQTQHLSTSSTSHFQHSPFLCNSDQSWILEETKIRTAPRSSSPRYRNRAFALQIARFRRPHPVRKREICFLWRENGVCWGGMNVTGERFVEREKVVPRPIVNVRNE